MRQNKLFSVLSPSSAFGGHVCRIFRSDLRFARKRQVVIICGKWKSYRCFPDFLFYGHSNGQAGCMIIAPDAFVNGKDFF